MDSARVTATGSNNLAAMYGDIDCLSVNPAGLADKKDIELNSTGESRFDGAMNLGSVNMTLKNIGFSIDYSSVPGIEKRDENRNHTGDFGMNEYGFTAGAGFALTKDLLIGSSGTVYSRSFDGNHSLGWYFTPGVIYKLGYKASVGLAADMIGQESSIADNGSFGLNSGIKSSLQVSPAKDLTVAGGVGYDKIAGAIFSLGGEYTIEKMLTVRAGYASPYESYGGITAGLGLKIKDYKLDASFNEHDALGSTIKVTLGMLFRTPVAKPTPIPTPIPTPVPTAVPTPVVVATPEPTPVPQPIKIDLGADKYLRVTGGTAFFKFKTSSLSDLTDDGKKYLNNAKSIISYLYSIGLCEYAVTVDGNASTEGTAEVNYKLSLQRAVCGKKFLEDSLKGIVDLSQMNIAAIPQGDSNSKAAEKKYVSDWKVSHGGVGPSEEDIEKFRRTCRNFRINIKINIEKWPDIKKDPAVIAKMGTLSSGLVGMLDRSYDAALSKHIPAVMTPVATVLPNKN